MAQLVKKLPAVQETWVRSLGWEDSLEKVMATHSSILAWRTPWAEEGFSGGSVAKESACNVGDLGSIPGLGRCPGGGKGHPLQYSGLENSMDRVVHGVTKSRTRLNDFHFLHKFVFCICDSISFL